MNKRPNVAGEVEGPRTAGSSVPSASGPDDPRSTFALLAVGLGVGAWVFLGLGTLFGHEGAFWLAGLGSASAAMVLGSSARGFTLSEPSRWAGWQVGVVGLVLGAVYAGLNFLLPLVLLSFVLVCASAPASGCAGVGAGGPECCGGSGPVGGCVIPVIGLVYPAVFRGARPKSVLDLETAFAHHPAGPAFSEDVFTVRGLRLCVGCLSMYPAFLALSIVLVAWGTVVLPSWRASTILGLVAIGCQGFSALGLTRRRRSKILVKMTLGVGVALFMFGLWMGNLSRFDTATALSALVLVGVLSTLPRAVRIERNQALPSGAVRGT